MNEKDFISQQKYNTLQNNKYFAGIDPNAEITRELSMKQMLFPPIGRDYDDLVQSGYDAMINWDGKYKTKIGTRFANTPVLLMLWPIKFLEVFITFVEDSFLYFANRIIYLPKSVANEIFKKSLWGSFIIKLVLPLLIIFSLLILPFPDIPSNPSYVSFSQSPPHSSLSIDSLSQYLHFILSQSSLLRAVLISIMITGLLEIYFPSVTRNTLLTT